MNFLTSCSTRIRELPVLTRRAGMVTVIALAGGAVSFAVVTLLARAVGVREFGIYSLVTTWVVVLSTVAKLGFDPGLIPYGTNYLSSGNARTFRSMTRRSSALAVVVGLACGGFLIVISHWTATHRADDVGTSFLVGAAMVPLVAWLQLNKVFLYCLRRHVWGGLAEQAGNLCVLVLVLVWLSVASGRDASVALLLTAAGFLTALAASAAILRHYTSAAIAFGADSQQSEPDMPAWVATGLPLLAVAGAQFALGRADVLVLGALRPVQEVGVYAVAVALTTPLEVLRGSAIMVVAPEIAELYSSGDLVALQRLVTRTLRGLLLVAVPIVTLSVAVGHPLLRLFGPGFEAGYPTLVFLALSQLVGTATGTSGYLLSMTGHEREFGLAMVPLSVVTVGSYFLFIPLWGSTGAAIATLITITLRSAVVAGMVVRLVGVVPLPMCTGQSTTCRLAP